MKVTFLERGTENNFRRYGDHERTVYLYRHWYSGGLLYGYIDRFNVITIAREDIISMEVC